MRPLSGWLRARTAQVRALDALSQSTDVLRMDLEDSASWRRSLLRSAARSTRSADC